MYCFPCLRISLFHMSHTACLPYHKSSHLGKLYSCDFWLRVYHQDNLHTSCPKCHRLGSKDRSCIFLPQNHNTLDENTIHICIRSSCYFQDTSIVLFVYWWLDLISRIYISLTWYRNTAIRDRGYIMCH